MPRPRATRRTADGIRIRREAEQRHSIRIHKPYCQERDLAEASYHCVSSPLDLSQQTGRGGRRVCPRAVAAQGGGSLV